MAKATSAALSAAAQEYLLAIRSHSEAEGVTPSLVAGDLGVSKQAAACDALAGLDKNCCEMMAVLMLMLVLHAVPPSSSV